MLKVGVIGIGNCGNQVACLAHKEADCEVICINTSENDLATIPDDIPKKLVGDSQGTGKKRDEAKKFLKNSIMEIMRDGDFTEFVQSKDVVIVVSSCGGGSGSGMAPLMTQILKESFRNPDGSEKNFILVGILPRLQEGESTQVNALSYLREVYEVLENPTYMLYDNNNFSKETSYMVLQKVNAAIVQDIKVIQCKYNAPTPYDSIDEKDMKTILSTPGRIMISGLYSIKEKDLDDATIEDNLIESLKKSAHAELQRDGLVVRTGLITNLDVKLNEMFDTHIEKVRQFVGEPTEEFLHIAVNAERSLDNNVILILTGLTKISDRIDKITDRIDEIESRQAAAEEQRIDGAISSDRLDALNAKSSKSTKVTSSDVNLKDIFSKFNA